MTLSGPSTEYHSKDFKWEDWRDEVESNPNYQYHFCPLHSLPQSQDYLAMQFNDDPLSGKEDAKAWESFHRRHSTGQFFKERRYLLNEFPDLSSSETPCFLLEVGCGSGSSVIPILRGNSTITVYACDYSSDILTKAQQIVDASNISNSNHRFFPFQCDFPASSSSDFPFKSFDFVTLIFTLSAVPLRRMGGMINECFSVLKRGGLLLFRDYGLYDMTMLRFEPHKRVGESEYMRSDGTRAYFFSLETVRDLFVSAGFVEVELEFCCVNSVNRRKGNSMKRVWVHGKFRKPV